MSGAAKKIDTILGPADLIQNVLSGNDHICQTDGFLFDLESQSVAALKTNKQLFFERPVSVILWPHEMATRDEKSSLILDRYFSSSLQKTLLLDEMRSALNGLTKSTSFIDEMCAVADEFVTNALFNAPFVDPLTNENIKLDRITTVVDLPRGKEARLFLAHDDQRLLIGIHDPFGSLNVQTYLERISKCYSAGVADSINFGKGGAGIGSYIIFNAGSSLYYGVKPGESTMLVCVVPLKLSRRAREDMPKHLHWIKSK